MDVKQQVGSVAVSELHNYFKSRNETKLDKMDLVHCDDKVQIMCLVLPMAGGVF